MTNYAILSLSPLLLFFVLHSARRNLRFGRRVYAICEIMFGIGLSGTLALMALVHIFELNIAGWIVNFLTPLLVLLCVLWILGALGRGWLALEEIL